MVEDDVVDLAPDLVLMLAGMARRGSFRPEHLRASPLREDARTVREAHAREAWPETPVRGVRRSTIHAEMSTVEVLVELRVGGGRVTTANPRRGGPEAPGPQVYVLSVLVHPPCALALERAIVDPATMLGLGGGRSCCRW
ncbi:hypothetical protein SAMD00023353_5100310 [Rosellinia necatrix]|uniref:Uncharacterized protein n=1 Tax=Rosellinia necatrix TaxID=77044 RepID=A0A1S8A9M5_ROSNE|nr:hypothetical protein SAMD00023353_5100310 [Rosellinia necatrix]